MGNRLTLQEFICKSNTRHLNKYDYSKSIYLNARGKTNIICPIHGEFSQTISNHLKGSGCNKCSRIQQSKLQIKNHDEFIKEAKLIHDNKYDYSKINYVNSKTKVIIICPEHGEFLQSPSDHLSGNGCAKCSGNAKHTKDSFVEKANVIHNNKYDYSKVDYVNNKTKVIIVCPEHGEFSQKTTNHLSGKGCAKCGGNAKHTKDSFIEKANAIHDNKYDYSKVDYVNNKTKVIIVCPEHGEFSQSPSKHIYGQSCTMCTNQKLSIKYRSSDEDFIKKANKIHYYKYNYSKVKYVNNSTKVIIICPEHGEFDQMPCNHLRGAECANCAGNAKHTIESFTQKADEVHCHKYDYSKVEWIDYRAKVLIICPEHGGFHQNRYDHLGGRGCPICKQSRGEKLIREILIKKKIKFKQQVKFNSCKKINALPFDFLIQLNANKKQYGLLEYQGEQHYYPIGFGGNDKIAFDKTQKSDLIKLNWCKNNNIPFLRIPYWNFNKIEQKINEFLVEFN